MRETGVSDFRSTKIVCAANPVLRNVYPVTSEREILECIPALTIRLKILIRSRGQILQSSSRLDRGPGGILNLQLNSSPVF